MNVAVRAPMSTDSPNDDRSIPARSHDRSGRGIPPSAFRPLDAPGRRVSSANVPLPFADTLEDQVIPTVDKVVASVTSVVNF